MPPTIIGIPYDAASSFARGAASAPALIRDELASDAGNGVTESLVDLRAPGVLGDVGDLDVNDVPDAHELIANAITTLVQRDAQPIVLGGDHSITYPVVRAVRERAPRLTLLQFDAHPDLYDVFEGNRLSHACPFARIMEAGLVDRLVQVGIRAANSHQRAQAERFGVETIDMRAWHRGARPHVDGPVYLSVDLDGLDPAYAPGVSHREPGGLSLRDVISVIQELPGPIVGADVVEFNPLHDSTGITAAVGAKLVREIAGRMIETRGQ